MTERAYRVEFTRKGRPANTSPVIVRASSVQDARERFMEIRKRWVHPPTITRVTRV